MKDKMGLALECAMLAIIAVVVILVIQACTPVMPTGGEEWAANQPRHISRHIDQEAQVVCWIITVTGRHSIGISCLPLSETALDY